MSYRAYNILSEKPDFTRDPIFGFAESGRGDSRVGMRPGFAEWHGDTSLAFRFDYRVKSPAEAILLRDKLAEWKGRWAAFYLPSWHPDLELALSASTGDTTIEINEWGYTSLAENRPDTPGRIIFLLNTDGTFQYAHVVSAITLGGGTEILTLDQPLQQDVDPATTMVGFCHLVRQADDINTFRMDKPGMGKLELRMVSVRNKRTIEAQQDLEASEIQSMQAFEDVLAYDENPAIFDYTVQDTKGPITYATTQGINYVTNWRATFDTDTSILLTDLDTSATQASSLYDESGRASHLAFCFDPVSREILAWNRDRDTLRVRWYEAGSPQSLDFDGHSPVLFNQWVIDSTESAGDAESAICYLKPGTSAIFCRLFADSFSVEYELCQSPAPPLYLHRVYFESGRIVIEGMDATHRRCEWRSTTYFPPIIDLGESAISLADGTLNQVAQPTDNLPEAATAAIAIAVGEFKSFVIDVDAGGSQAGSTAEIAAGAYVNRRKATDPLGDDATSAVVLEDGAYTLIARPSDNQDDAGEAGVAIATGTYESV